MHPTEPWTPREICSHASDVRWTWVTVPGVSCGVSCGDAGIEVSRRVELQHPDQVGGTAAALEAPGHDDDGVAPPYATTAEDGVGDLGHYVVKVPGQGGHEGLHPPGERQAAPDGRVGRDRQHGHWRALR